MPTETWPGQCQTRAAVTPSTPYASSSVRRIRAGSTCEAETRGAPADSDSSMGDDINPNLARTMFKLGKERARSFFAPPGGAASLACSLERQTEHLGRHLVEP